MSANSYSRTPAVLSGLPAWEENLDEIDDEGDEGDLEGEEEEAAAVAVKAEEDNSPVSFEEAKEHLDAMSDWISFMSRKFTTQEADTIYRRLNKLNKFFRPPQTQAQEPQVTIHAQSNGLSAANVSAEGEDTKAAERETQTIAAEKEEVEAKTEDLQEGEEEENKKEGDWFAKWPCVSGLVRDGTPLLPLNAQNLITEYDARLWFPASADVVRVCPGWVAVNVDRCIWGCLDKSWLEHRLLQEGDKGGIDDYTWGKYLRMHRAYEVFPLATTEALFQDFQAMMNGGPGFACDCCAGYKDFTRKCKQCGMEKCEECVADTVAPLHFKGCQHFDEEEEKKRVGLRLDRVKGGEQ